nr:sugar transferase [Paenibacillus koleovorans]
MSLPELDIKLEAGDYNKPLHSRKNSQVRRTRYEIMKRFMDIVGAVMGIVFLFPIFVLIALFIKLEDPKGRVFYKQTRVGKNGKVFEMYKFRSMITNAEELLPTLQHLNERSGAVFKMKADPRVTRVGSFIRRTSIDELPQFLNVLKGDMSMVGPRPPLPQEVEMYTAYDKQRLIVTPGCTGPWQVSGRNHMSFKEMVSLDLKYISERSLMLDIKLILKTVGVMVWSRNGH